MRSVFGWSYPPGCSGPPDGELQCDVCKREVGQCICPECPQCGETGNPRCYEDHGLVRTPEQDASAESYRTHAEAERHSSDAGVET